MFLLKIARLLLRFGWRQECVWLMLLYTRHKRLSFRLGLVKAGEEQKSGNLYATEFTETWWRHAL
jgi:hypothetical protein